MNTTIIITNFHGDEDSIECLQSLLVAEDNNFNIVVVDNSEGDYSLNKILAWIQNPIIVDTLKTIDSHRLNEYGEIRYTHLNVGEVSNITFEYNKEIIVIKSRSNLGFGAACNDGLRYCLEWMSSDLIYFLNNDAVLKSGTVNELAKYFTENTNAGIMGTAVMEYRDPSIVQTIGGKYNQFMGTDRQVLKGIHVDVLNQKLKTSEIDYPSGASLVITKKYAVEVGGMTEDFFLYFEELDLISRGKNFSFAKTGCIPNTFVYHKGGSSINGAEKRSKVSDYFILRSRLLFTSRHFPLMLPFVYIFTIPFILNKIRRGQFSRIPTLLRICLNPAMTINKLL